MAVGLSGKLAALSARWQVLEDRIKGAEQISGSVVVPAINELRYAGRRFIEAWDLFERGLTTAEDREKFQVNISMAEQYFNNADDDLADSLVSFYDIRKRQLLNIYSIKQASDIYGRFVTWVDLVNRAQELIRGSRSNRAIRSHNYQILQVEVLPALEEHYRLIVSDEVLYKRKASRWRFYRDIVGFGGFVAWVIGIVAEWDKATSVFEHAYTWLKSHLP